MDIEKINHEGHLWAILIRAGQVSPGIHFATPDDNALQVGKQLRPKGTVIKPHAHCAVSMNKQSFLQEVLYIERGRLKVIFYKENGVAVDERILSAGDTILLVQGGHGFEALDDVQMVEVKMGPYDPSSKKNIEAKQ
jgi:cupin fold WbuC family metalloprotein